MHWISSLPWRQSHELLLPSLCSCPVLWGAQQPWAEGFESCYTCLDQLMDQIFTCCGQANGDDAGQASATRAALAEALLCPKPLVARLVHCHLLHVPLCVTPGPDQLVCLSDPFPGDSAFWSSLGPGVSLKVPKPTLEALLPSSSPCVSACSGFRPALMLRTVGATLPSGTPPTIGCAHFSPWCL